LGGYEVLVGRGDNENDELTFEVAAPGDMWMHVAGTPGSHVVIRCPDDMPDPPRDVIERAARLAGWYSKSRAARRVDVHFCRARDVSKPRGWPAGKVLLRSWSVLRVPPQRLDSDDGMSDG